MNKGPHVLVVSRDEMLLRTRSLILGAYFQVESAGRVAEAELAMSRINFDLVILCHSLFDDEYAKMLELCKLHDPQPRILTLDAASKTRRTVGNDGDSAMENAPYELLKGAAELVGYTLKPMGRASHN